MSFYVVNRDRPRIHHRFLVGLRHGWMVLCQFDGWFKMTIPGEFVLTASL